MRIFLRCPLLLRSRSFGEREGVQAAVSFHECMRLALRSLDGT